MKIVVRANANGWQWVHTSKLIHCAITQKIILLAFLTSLLSLLNLNLELIHSPDTFSLTMMQALTRPVKGQRQMWHGCSPEGNFWGVSGNGLACSGTGVRTQWGPRKRAVRAVFLKQISMHYHWDFKIERIKENMNSKVSPREIFSGFLTFSVYKYSTVNLSQMGFCK